MHNTCVCALPARLPAGARGKGQRRNELRGGWGVCGRSERRASRNTPRLIPNGHCATSRRLYLDGVRSAS